MKTSAGQARTLYQASITGVWLVGVFFLVQTITLITSVMIDIDPQPMTLIVIGNVAMAGLSIFSFWAGAQRGHWVRASTVVLFTLFEMFLNRAYVKDDSNIGLHSQTWAIGLAIILLNLRFASKFKRQFKAVGRVDYFDIYF